MSTSTPEASVVEPDSHLESSLGSVAPQASPWLILALLAGAHFLVDIVAGSTNPLWPELERSLSVETGGLLWVYVCWSLTTSFSQLFFGIWADRHPCRWLIGVGPLLAIVCVNCVGRVDSAVGVAVLFAIGGLGVAAFHPEAAATAGALLPRQRSRAMAIFALCGYLGQSVGPFYSGTIIEQLGLPGLSWGIVWGLPVLGLLWLGLRRAPAPVLHDHHRAATTEQVAFPIGTLLLLLAVGALRVLPALGVPLALAYLLKASSTSTSVIGAVQSAFMGGIGIGSMACAAFLQHRWERTSLWLFPLLASPVLAIIGYASGWTQVVLVGSCGVLLGITMPVYISYGQQLLPNGQRVASSITMGVSWGIGGAMTAIAMYLFNSFDALSSIFIFFAVASFASSLLCHLLPVSK